MIMRLVRGNRAFIISRVIFLFSAVLNDVVFVERETRDSVRDRDCSPAKKRTFQFILGLFVLENDPNNEVETICIGRGKFSQIFQYVGIIPQR